MSSISIFLTSYLIHEAKVSPWVRLIPELSDPDVELVCVASTMVKVELEALDVTLPCGAHSFGLQPGWVSLLTRCCASMHEVTWEVFGFDFFSLVCLELIFRDLVVIQYVTRLLYLLSCPGWCGQYEALQQHCLLSSNLEPNLFYKSSSHRHQHWWSCSAP